MTKIREKDVGSSNRMSGADTRHCWSANIRNTKLGVQSNDDEHDEKQ
jgi:hypothetical protein